MKRISRDEYRIVVEFTRDEFEKILNVVMSAEQYLDKIDPYIINLDSEEIAKLRKNISETI